MYVCMHYMYLCKHAHNIVSHHHQPAAIPLFGHLFFVSLFHPFLFVSYKVDWDINKSTVET